MTEKQLQIWTSLWSGNSFSLLYIADLIYLTLFFQAIVIIYKIYFYLFSLPWLQHTILSYRLHFIVIIIYCFYIVRETYIVLYSW